MSQEEKIISQGEKSKLSEAQLSEAQLSEFKQFLSDWSRKEVKGEKINNLFPLGGFPLSWYYRPILYSSLLPPPFVTAAGFFSGKGAGRRDRNKLKLYSFAFRKSLLMRDFLHHFLRRKVRRKAGLGAEKKLSKGSAPSTPGKILFLTFTNYTRDNIKDNSPSFREAKIMELIEKEGKYEPLMLAAEPLSSFSPRKIRRLSHTLYDYYTDETRRKAKEKAREFARRWREICPEEKKRILSFAGRDVFRYYRENLDFLYSEELIFTVARLYYAYLSLLKEEKIKAVVLSSQNNLIEKSLVAAAFAEDVPVFIIQHGIGLGAYPTIDTPDNVKFAVFSERYRQELSALGIRKENIEVVGPIIFDGIEKFAGRKDVHLNRREGGRKVLLATSPFVEDRFLEKEEYFRKVRRLLKELKMTASQITIKLHPRERYRKEYQRMIDELSRPAGLSSANLPAANPPPVGLSQVIDREEHYRLIWESDLVVTFGSTVALEAMIIGRPTLTVELFDGINPTNEKVRHPEATTMVRHDGKIREEAGRLLEEGEQKEPGKLVADLCYRPDGKASERIVDFIYRCIGEDSNYRK